MGARNYHAFRPLKLARAPRHYRLPQEAPMRSFAFALLISSAAMARSEDREVPRFDAVHISSGMHARIVIGPQKAVHVEGDDESLARLELTVEDGELNAHFKEGSWFHSERAVKLTIQAPAVRSVGASGGSIVDADLTRSDKSSVQASGGSEMNVRGVDAAELSLQASGGSILTVSGRADEMDLQLSGGSQLHGHELEVRNLEIQGSGGSQAELSASGKIRGGLSGGSQLHARGGGRASVHTSGGSEVDVDD